jgi:non-heme chloroperoxidase
MLTGLRFAVAINIAFCAACFPQARLHNTPSHAVHFVVVEKNVQLEVLDWGGKGKSIVLLAGGGNTAHVFDDFAPKLTTNFHVYGITRRGFGSSQFSPVDDKDRLAKDILVVLDSMKIDNPVLIGHSIAGVELSSIARLSPKRVSALIYLEAGYPYAFSNGQSPGMNEFFDVKGPQQPSPEEKDLTSFKALQDWNTETYGFQLPEAEFRQTWDSTAEGRVTRRRDSPGFAIFPMMLNNSKRNDSISLPSLVIFAMPHVKEAWMINNTDENVRREAGIYFSKIDSLTIKQANAFEDGVPSAQILKLRGMHYIFISNETEVINAIKKCIKRLE